MTNLDTTALETFGQSAHRVTVETDVHAIAGFLREVFGIKVTAYLAKVADPKTVVRWIAGDQHPRPNAEARLRVAFQVFQFLQQCDSPHTVRAWFVGMNPELDDVSPVRAIREGLSQEVMVAAKTFAAGG